MKDKGYVAGFQILALIVQLRLVQSMSVRQVHLLLLMKILLDLC